ncbi:MAG: glycine zipper 2TM domain-containing protein [Gammaproteobacteria bacterium]
MVKTITTVAVIGLLGANAAFAGHDDDRGYGHRGPEVAYGRVIDVDPITHYATVNQPRQECRDEYVRQQPGVAGPTAAGAVIGAAIGRQFGGGSGRDLATAAGAVAGGLIANQRAQRNQGYREVPVERCRVVNERVTERVVDGYNVTYVYQGRRYVTRTATPPGDRIELAVDVRPVGYTTWR